MPLYRLVFVKALYAFAGGMARAAGLTITAQLEPQFAFHRLGPNDGCLIFIGSVLQLDIRQSMSARSRRRQDRTFCDQRIRIQALGLKGQALRRVDGPKGGGAVLMMR